MQLIIGGACSGKRKVIRTRLGEHSLSWVSSYNGEDVRHWRSLWQDDSVLVLEGFENWLLDEIRGADDVKTFSADTFRNRYRELFHTLMLEEERRGQRVCLLMLETGRGIVPMDEEDRLLRDLNGWIQQDAAVLADEVHYVWHGLVKKMK